MEAIEKTSLRDFSTFGTIEVPMTYEGYPTITFKFRRSLGAELKKLQQEFYAKTKDEQMEIQFQSRVTHLSKVLKEAPVGLPGFVESGTLEESFVRYFGDSSDFEDLIDTLWTLYQNKLYPKELLPAASE